MSKNNRNAKDVIGAIEQYIKEIDNMEYDVNQQNFEVFKATVENKMYESYEWKKELIAKIIVSFNSVLAVVWALISCFNDKLQITNIIIVILNITMSHLVFYIILFFDLILLLIGIKILFGTDKSVVKRYEKAYELLTYELYTAYKANGLGRHISSNQSE